MVIPCILINLALGSIAPPNEPLLVHSDLVNVAVTREILESDIYQRLRERLDRTETDGYWVRYRDYTVSQILVERLRSLDALNDDSWNFTRELLVRSVARDMYAYIAMLPPEDVARTKRDAQIDETSRLLRDLVEQRVSGRGLDPATRRAIVSDLGSVLVGFLEPETAPAPQWWARSERPSPAAQNPDVARGVVLRVVELCAQEPTQ